MIYIGIDVGGLSFKAGAVDENGNILCKADCPSGVDRGYGPMIRDMAELAFRVTEMSGHTMADVKSIGIGIPGIMDQQTGRVPRCANLLWNDVPIMDEMRKYTDLPVYVDNDATVAGLAESVAGVSAGVKNSVFITLGTGIGGGIILDGKVFTGSHGVASEIGHSITVDGGEPCNCGKRGCWERYASATALIREGRRLCERDPECALMRAVDGALDAITAKHIFDLAKEGDPGCTELFNWYVHHLCLGIRNLINTYDPEMFVLGGGVSHAGDFLLNAVRRELPNWVFFRTMPYGSVELARLSNDAGIIGAAMLGR